MGTKPLLRVFGLSFSFVRTNQSVSGVKRHWTVTAYRHPILTPLVLSRPRRPAPMQARVMLAARWVLPVHNLSLFDTLWLCSQRAKTSDQVACFTR